MGNAIQKKPQQNIQITWFIVFLLENNDDVYLYMWSTLLYIGIPDQRTQSTVCLW